MLLLPLVLLSFRKGVFVCFACTLLLPAPQAHANTAGDIWDSLWLRSDQRGHQALRYGEPEKAVTLFDGQSQWQSVAQYRSGDYARSLLGFRQDATVTGRYNEGNSLARLGEYEAAIASYEQVLSAQPEHEDALFNKELVERLLKEQQQAQQQQDQDQQSQANNQDGENEQSNQQQQQDQSEQEQESDNSEEREQEKSDDQRGNGQEGTSHGLTSGASLCVGEQRCHGAG